MQKETKELISIIANAKDSNKAIEIAFALLVAFEKQKAENKAMSK